MHDTGTCNLINHFDFWPSLAKFLANDLWHSNLFLTNLNSGRFKIWNVYNSEMLVSHNLNASSSLNRCFPHYTSHYRGCIDYVQDNTIYFIIFKFMSIKCWLHTTWMSVAYKVDVLFTMPHILEGKLIVLFIDQATTPHEYACLYCLVVNIFNIFLVLYRIN